MQTKILTRRNKDLNANKKVTDRRISIYDLWNEEEDFLYKNRKENPKDFT